MVNDTIVAIATPPGRGGVGILRLSGPDAYPIALKISHKQVLKHRSFSFSQFYNTLGDVIDHGLMLFFQSPYSFTGEDVVELQAHGSPVVLDMILKTCLEYGCRMARPGEFSERAFLNDKMDLTQAEAISDLIQASSETSAKMALRSLQGDFSKKIHELNESLIHLRLYVEAAIDFPDEEIDFLSDGKVAAMLSGIYQQLHDIRSKAGQGAIIREGVSVVIAGKPNAGKSTLINQLSGKEVAIVTDIAGTTRDVMREHILLDDIPVHIIDTAGLRHSDDVIEQEGIKRAWNEVKQADCVLYVADITEPANDETLLNDIKQAIPSHAPIIQIVNKIDLQKQSQALTTDTIAISAKSGAGIQHLKDAIKRAIGYQPNEGVFLARRRHLEALDLAKSYLDAGKIQLEDYKAGELLAEDLRLAQQALCEITGEFTSDDLLGRIFSSFCIGK